MPAHGGIKKTPLFERVDITGGLSGCDVLVELFKGDESSPLIGDARAHFAGDPPAGEVFGTFEGAIRRVHTNAIGVLTMQHVGGAWFPAVSAVGLCDGHALGSGDAGRRRTGG